MGGWVEEVEGLTERNWNELHSKASSCISFCNCCCSSSCCNWYSAILSFYHFAFPDTFIAAISDTNWFHSFFFVSWFSNLTIDETVKLKRGTKYSKVLQTDIEQLICNYQGYTNYPVNLLAATPEHIVQNTLSKTLNGTGHILYLIDTYNHWNTVSTTKFAALRQLWIFKDK